MNTIKNAQEAREISEKNKVTVDKVLEFVMTSSQQGNRQCTVFNYVPNDVICNLVNRGFSCKIEVVNAIEKALVIEW